MDPGMECTVVNSRQCHGLHILVKVFCSNLLGMSPCTLHLGRQHLPTQNTFPWNQLHPLAEITNLLHPEFPTSSNRVWDKLLQYFQRNDLWGLMDPGLITLPIWLVRTGADIPAKTITVAKQDSLNLYFRKNMTMWSSLDYFRSVHPSQWYIYGCVGQDIIRGP